jgi:hypothetical protein
MNFGGVSMRGLTFFECDLGGANLDGCDLTGVTFYCCDADASVVGAIAKTLRLVGTDGGIKRGKLTATTGVVSGTRTTFSEVVIARHRQQRTLKIQTARSDNGSMGWFKSLALAVAALVIINACGDDAVRGVGRMMLDAGEALGGRAAQDPNAGTGSSNMGGKGSSYEGRDGGVLSDAGRMLADAGRALVDAGREQVRDASADTPPTATSGSRIKLRRNTYAGSDGTRYEEPWAAFFDSSLGVSCSPYTTSDGKQRCVPQLGVSAAGISTVFADASCTDRLAIVPVPACDASAARFAYETSSEKTQCSGREVTRSFYRFYRLGAQHTGSVWTKDYQGVCKSASAAIEGYQYYPLGAEMQPSEFVEFTATTEDVP